MLPPQRLPDLAGVPRGTVLALLVMAVPVAGLVEEAAIRGYMQGPIERRVGLPVAILVTGTMYAAFAATAVGFLAIALLTLWSFRRIASR